MRKAQWYDKIFHWTLFDAALRWQLRFSTFGNHRSTLYYWSIFFLDGFSMEHMKDTGSSTPWTKGKSVSTTSGYHSQLSAGWLWQAIRTQSTLCLQWSFPAADRSHWTALCSATCCVKRIEELMKKIIWNADFGWFWFGFSKATPVQDMNPLLQLRWRWLWISWRLLPLP